MRKKQCSGMCAGDGWGTPVRCSRTGFVYRKKKYFCWQHDPERGPVCNHRYHFERRTKKNIFYRCKWCKKGKKEILR